MQSDFLPAAIKRFQSYKDLGDKTFEQLHDHDLSYQPSPESNSIAVIIQHVYGNAMSRWTNFLTEDGEKEWRNRDQEFEPVNRTREDLLSLWNSAWQLVFTTVEDLQPEDLFKTVYIRREPLFVFDAILRQIAHYAYHVGQIVYMGKLLKDKEWESLSIPKNKSIEYNQSLRK